MSRTPLLPLALALTAALASAGSGCSADPVHSQKVQALGGEVNGIPKGQYHRAGQPCLVCHGGDGPASTVFTVAGTIFYGPTHAVGVDQAEVLIVDSAGTQQTLRTNCVGNFYALKADFDAKFPMRVAVAMQGQPDRRMASLIGRDGSCAGCHKLPSAFTGLNGNAYDFLHHVSIVTSGVEAKGYTPPPCAVSPVAPNQPDVVGP